MKRSILSLAAGCCTFLLTFGLAGAQQVPQALTSAGPALATFDNLLYLAWAGAAPVGTRRTWFATFDGTSWSAQSRVADSFTIFAPALAVANKQLYLATTPPDTNGEIDLFVLDGATFMSNGTLCGGQTCAQTTAAPALIGNGADLYAAWTTPNDEIQYAERVNGVWSIATNPIPNAHPLPGTGPTLAILDHRLYLAWSPATGGAVSVTSASLPLSANPWSEAVEIQAPTETAPALGVFSSVVNDALVPALYVSWTISSSSRLGFAKWNPGIGQWDLAPSPVPLPNGPLTVFTPATNSACIAPTAGLAGPDSEALASTQRNVIVYADGANGEPHGIIANYFAQRITGCPKAPPAP
jgi:hypothetical protein